MEGNFEISESIEAMMKLEKIIGLSKKLQLQLPIDKFEGRA